MVIDLQKEVVNRVQNAVHSLKKELETAGVDVSAVTVENQPDGVLVYIKPASRPPVDNEAEELPMVDAAGAGISGFIPADGQWHPLGYTTDSTDSLSVDGTTGDDGLTGDK